MNTQQIIVRPAFGGPAHLSRAFLRYASDVDTFYRGQAWHDMSAWEHGLQVEAYRQLDEELQVGQPIELKSSPGGKPVMRGVVTGIRMVEAEELASLPGPAMQCTAPLDLIYAGGLRQDRFWYVTFEATEEML